jgi:hypothetical protein
VNGKGLALVIRMIGLSDKSIIFIIDVGKNVKLIISLKASAWKLSQKVRNFIKPESYVISDNHIYVGDVFKSFLLQK